MYSADFPTMPAFSVRSGVSSGVGAVRNRVSGLLDTESGPLAPVADRVHAVRDGAKGAGEGFEGRVREKPLQTLIVAGVAGFVLGRLLR